MNVNTWIKLDIFEGNSEDRKNNRINRAVNGAANIHIFKVRSAASFCAAVRLADALACQVEGIDNTTNQASTSTSISGVTDHGLIRLAELAPSLERTKAMDQEQAVANVEQAIKSNKEQKTKLMGYIQSLEAQLKTVDALIVGNPSCASAAEL